MTAVLTATFYYVTYPFFLLFSLLLTIAAPLVHLAHYVVHGLWWWPLGIVAKFETLYIFFGVAALVGVLAGTGLHFVSSYLVAVFSLEPTPPSSSSEQPQQQQQWSLRPLAEVREGRRREGGCDEMGWRTLKRSGKGTKEEHRDDERVWQERVEGAYRRAEGMQEERAAAAATIVGRGRGKGKNAYYGDWSGRQEKERDGGREKGGESVMTSTIMEEESSSELGF